MNWEDLDIHEMYPFLCDIKAEKKGITKGLTILIFKLINWKINVDACIGARRWLRLGYCRIIEVYEASLLYFIGQTKLACIMVRSDVCYLQTNNLYKLSMTG